MSKWTKGLRLKLVGIGFLPVMVLGVLSYISLTSVSDLGGRIETAYKVRAKLIETAGELDSSVHALGRWMWITYGLAGQVEARNNFIKRSLDELDQFEKAKNIYLSLPRNEKIKDMFLAVEKGWPLVRLGAEEAIALFKAHNERDNELAKKVMQEKFLPHLVPITKTMNEIKSQMSQLLVAETESSSALVASTYRAVFTISGLSMAFCLESSILFAISLAKRLTKISGSLHEASLQVHSASSQIASSSEELSQAATEQAASLEQTASALEEITSMISKSTDSAKMTSSSSSQSQTKAEEGRAAVDQMITSMDEISQSNEAIMAQINQSNQQMADIVRVIQEIGEKTKVINDIVFQTKLLSFNASVEAARAGEHGKGFAVVAEEVGNLAQMSGNAASEISQMLTGSISKVEGIVNDTKRKVETLVSLGKQKVESGVGVAKQCAEVLNEIVENVSKVAGLAHEISSASQQQAQGVAEINKAMSQLDTVTQQNASTSEEAASAAEELSAQAEALKGSVEDLVRTVDGANESGAPKLESAHPGLSSFSKSSKGSAKVIHLRAPKNVVDTSHGEHKSAVGDGLVPARNHNGFKDV